MKSHHSNTRRTRLSLSTLSLISLSSLSSAIVIPPSFKLAKSYASALSHDSSSRKSINFGPHIPTSHHTLVNPSLPLALYNAEAHVLGALSQSTCERHGGSATDPATCLGTGIATAFLAVLHPASEFKLVDGYVTKHSNVFHAYYLELINGVPVANGNLNVNVNLATGEIISYGDSSFASSTTSATTSTPKLEDWKSKVAGWASGAAGQMVLGGDATRQGDEESFSSPPFNPSLLDYEVDPRHGLISFLALQSPFEGVTDFLLSTPRTDLISLFSLDPSSPHSFEINNVPSTLEPVKATLAYVHDGEKLTLAWKYQVVTNDNMYEAYVGAESGVQGDEETLMVVDWVRDFRPTGGEVTMESLMKSTQGLKKRGHVAATDAYRVGFAGRPQGAKKVIAERVLDEEEVRRFKELKPVYKVFPWGINAPDVGKRSLLKGSAIELDDEASPIGWHTIPAGYAGGKEKFFFDTRGNNVFAQDNPDGGNQYEYNYRPVTEDLKFDFKLGWPKEGTPLTPSTYINASVTELFYTNNEFHDLLHRYGFDEPAGNFQEFNFGRGGLGNDAVQANAQDGSGMNNANFATPPDGSRPRMRMYSWTGTQPYRDGDFEAGIVIHEYAHGLSTRLTGGPANSGCLGWGEAGGMGEGWGDFLATMIRMHSANETQFSMGEWASSRVGGIRNYEYSRNITVNPSTYSFLDKSGYWGVHAIGEVWAEILFTVAELFIDAHGFENTLFPPPTNATDSTFYDETYTDTKVPKSGNTLIVQLVIDAMKLQPCRPSFQNARDAIIAADKVLTGGKNECILWKGFSFRGLGPDATVVGSTPWGGGIRTNDFEIPAKCGKTKKNLKLKAF